MAQLQLIKLVAALPANLAADTIYFVRVGTGFDLYVTNHAGTIVSYTLNSRYQADYYGSPTATGVINATWTKPSWAKYVMVLIQQAGTGGASGRRGALNTARTGGTGGPGGSLVEARFEAILLPASVAVVVQPGGLGGAPVTANSTNGNPGAAPGGFTQFGTYLIGARVYPNGGSPGGTAAAQAAPAATATTYTGGAGGATSITGAAPVVQNTSRAASGGGAGGTITAAEALLDPSRGAGLPAPAYGTIAGGSPGGAAGTSGSLAGADGLDLALGTDFGAPGGGGGYPSKTNGTPAGAGGRGAFPGGGGAGGGAGTDDLAASGAGGNGGNGYVRVLTFG